MGTPVGLRSLFPTNHVRVRTRPLNLTEIQRIIMTKKQEKPVQPDNTVASPSDNASDAMRAPVDAGGRDLSRQLQDDPDAGHDAEVRALDRDNGDEGTPHPVTDPGPPPSMPEYTGPMTTAVDYLLMAGTARDADAVRSVTTIGEPPAVAQYKANLLHWLDAMDAHDANQSLPDAERGIDPDTVQDDGDRDFGRNDGGGPA